VGFCFGGTQAMQLGIRNPHLAANVIFYGSGLVTDPNQLGSLGANGPVLGIFGEQDSSIPLDKVYGFEQALQDLGILYRVSIYPGVGHAFVTPESLSVPGAAQDAWNEMLGFLDEALH
jgi:carboxymethylenebutenolidase